MTASMYNMLNWISVSHLIVYNVAKIIEMNKAFNRCIYEDTSGEINNSYPFLPLYFCQGLTNEKIDFKSLKI